MATKTIPVNGKRLRRIRKGRGWSQGMLAAESNVSRSYITEIENGSKQPSIHIARILAMALDVGVDELVSSTKEWDELSY